jgi:hypothetical protein
MLCNRLLAIVNVYLLKKFKIAKRLLAQNKKSAEYKNLKAG